MQHARKLALWVLMVAIGLGLTMGPVPRAAASCAFPQPLGRALIRVVRTSPTVFVGTVTATSNSGRTARVVVQEVWGGSQVQKSVVVLGSYVTGHAATSVDRTFQVGVRYLFVPEPTARQSPYQDNICTATRPYTAKLAHYRPPGAHRVGAHPR